MQSYRETSQQVTYFFLWVTHGSGGKTEEKRVEIRVRYRLRLFTALYFTYFYSTFDHERGDIISRELDASAKRRLALLLARFACHHFVLRARFFFSRTLKNTKAVNSLPHRLYVAFFCPGLRPAPSARSQVTVLPACGWKMEHLTRNREISFITVIPSEYLRESLDALKCSLMNQPVSVTDQGGEHGCDVTKDCRLRMKKK